MIYEHDEKESNWMRVLFVLLFWVIFYLTQMVLVAVAVGQCAFLLITGNANNYLMQAGDSLGKYVSELLRYVTFNSNQRPFPFTGFPKSDLVES
ncbi:MAG: DUF4389 domain-containing protein [Proteobacteria bacterium]|jgi:hypothetical protein|nr:DUF4389 domain-containing protein [Pseudomonadota bacterium]